MVLSRKHLAVVPSQTPELEQIKQAALTLVSQRRRDTYAIGTLWNRLVTALHSRSLEGGATAWWASNVPADVQPRMARMYGRIAAAFTPEVAGAYDVVKLNSLLTYCQLRKVPPSADPGSQLISWTDKKGKAQQKTFAKCTEHELSEAVRSAQPVHRPPSLPEGVADAFEAVAKDLAPIVIEDEDFRFEPRMQKGALRILLDVDAHIYPDVLDALEKAGLSFG